MFLCSLGGPHWALGLKTRALHALDLGGSLKFMEALTTGQGLFFFFF